MYIARYTAHKKKERIALLFIFIKTQTKIQPRMTLMKFWLYSQPKTAHSLKNNAIPSTGRTPSTAITPLTIKSPWSAPTTKPKSPFTVPASAPLTRYFVFFCSLFPSLHLYVRGHAISCEGKRFAGERIGADLALLEALAVRALIHGRIGFVRTDLNAV